jgi:quercetin dioxygenase-like cupin family protein
VSHLAGLLLLFLTTVCIAHDPSEKNADSVDTNSVPWSHAPIPELDHQLPIKPLLNDAETGVSVMKIKYEAGFTNTWHTHNTGHGMYVLDGILDTSKGQFSPGEFVWFPEGERMFHGATEENDAVFIFITNKKFDIHYEESE